MSRAEMQTIVDKATECSEQECPVDAVDDLISELKSQKEEAKNRIDMVRNMIKKLEHLNGEEEKEPEKRNEIMETIRSVLRVFLISAEASGCDYPDSGMAVGFSGDIRKPTTAYKALKPKPWKPKAKP